jgi:hypothetical protein
MPNVYKSQAGFVPLLLALLLLSGTLLGIVVYRQIKFKDTAPLSYEANNQSSQALKQFTANRSEIEIKEWGVKLPIPAAYKDNLYYELSNLDFDDNANGSFSPAGRGVSFSFRSIVRDYAECAPYYQRVALLRRVPVAFANPPLPAEKYTSKVIRRIGDFEYSYILPRQACIEGSFPYHGQHRQLYDQFRASFPELSQGLQPL